ncbi:DUF2147 domain-containing protein [uncultured Shimia sp.]|uniref:DUF2147 domain-containing protein n=1 Tax=uncultured Shimia sp. TaxID=573152 RepID=UPI002625083F|nr:DUF2147 domain-containing protein [uncultured Shimia sp.]
MKKLVMATAFAVLGTSVMADPAAGLWKTEPGETGGYLHVQIAPCGAALCGTIAAAYDETGAKSPDYEHMGKKLLWDMNADGGGKYSGGQIWAPDTDKTYKSKMSLSGSTLSVRGYVGVSAFGRSQDWKRVN